MNAPDPPPQQPPEQLRFAAWIEAGTRLGLLVLVLSFAAYVLGWLPSAVPPEQLAQLWSLPVEQLLQQTGRGAGWSWLGHLGEGDGVALLGIVVLAGCAVPALLALVPGLWDRRDRALALLCAAESLVILLAATGWLIGRH
ncbi:MAG: hypothetical protein JNJ71_01935 [Rubrivivax sp.]|nr:hypothetical protein [Rubrivivax sp.]